MPADRLACLSKGWNGERLRITSPSQLRLAAFAARASYLSPEGKRFGTAINHDPPRPHHPHQHRRRRNHPEHLDVHAVRHRQAARGG